MMMNKAERHRFSERYVGQMRKYFERGALADLTAAQGLGWEAAASGLVTLELAKIHEQALAALGETDGAAMSRDELRRRGESFFTEVLIPVEQTHPAALEGTANLDHLSTKLVQLTLELIDSKRELQLQILQRETAEKAIKTSGEESARLLEEAQRLQERLQMTARKILSEQEESRQKVSLELRDEIVQTLCGINIRLLALKEKNGANHEELTKEIASTERIVRKSMKTIDHYAREFRIRREKQ